MCPPPLHCARAAGAEWEADHRSCTEEPLRCLCVCGEQHCGSENEQGGSAFCAGWDDSPVTAHYCFNSTNFEFSPTFWVNQMAPRYLTVQCSAELLLSSAAAKPVLVLKPDNVSVRTGESAQFYCQAKGDPSPAVVWSREQGPLPNGRYFMMEIHRHEIYICFQTTTTCR